tara:strand:+ start:106 stop:1386 length:1281 start_codon:yes stop_codon:yes gene_type:complete
MQSFKKHLEKENYHELEEFRKIKGLVKSTIKKLTATWTKLKKAIISGFKKSVKKAKLFEPVEIVIPSQMKEDILKDNAKLLKESSGAVSAIKGNYNEALVVQYLFNHPGDEVIINKKYEKYRNDINHTAQGWDKKLKEADPKNYSKLFKIIERGSKDMANYLITVAQAEESTIIGAYLDNLAFQDGIDFKADIRVAVEKRGKEILNSYSLKLYSTKSVGLANTTAKGLCGHLGGPAAAKEFESVAKSDSKLEELIKKAKYWNAVKQDHKKHLKGDEKATNRLQTLRGLNANEIDKLDQNEIAKERRVARQPINPRIAELVYSVVKKLEGTDILSENILKIMGFQDKNTKMLMAVTTEKKSEIIARHPDLDLSGITIEDPKGRVSINIKGPTGKTIVTFGVKEGEKKAVSGAVSFAGIEPEDYDEYI